MTGYNSNNSTLKLYLKEFIVRFVFGAKEKYDVLYDQKKN